jgi:flagellar biosynthesis GTPase FlhF
VAEVTTAGAVYGGVGALTVGNVFVKMRTIFFEKGQIPFIAIVAVLLILDGVLNTQLSSANWPVFLHAMLLPFGVGGIVLGTVGVTLLGLINKNAQVQEAKKSEDSAPETKKASPSKPEPKKSVAPKAEAKKTAAPKAEAKKPVVSSKPKEVIPTKTSTEDVASQQRIAERRAAEKKAEEERIRAEQKAAAEQLLAERRAAEKKAQERKSALKEDTPVEQKVVAKETVATAPIENLDTKSVKKEEPATSNESKQGDEKSTSEGDITSDWLSSQLNLLNKISKNEDKDK